MTSSSFRSPWQSPTYVALIELVRRCLRPWPTTEHRFVAKLVRDNNVRVHSHLSNRPVRQVLLIMPRCLKKSGCRVRVQDSTDECLTCRQCPLGDVADLCRRFGLQALIAFRSHIAFDMARREQPDVIIASACHDRLVKALHSVPEIPALLAPLTGMERMCVNATLDEIWLLEQLQTLAHEVPAQAVPATAAARTATGP